MASPPSPSDPHHSARPRDAGDDGNAMTESRRTTHETRTNTVGLGAVGTEEHAVSPERQRQKAAPGAG
jgi:hypothetical protein